MKRIAKFEKVSREEFTAAINELTHCSLSNDRINQLYDELKLPKRATKGSAGYDFFAPLVLRIDPGETIKIPTGIRVKMDEGWVLKIYPRSGLGFKYKLRLNNTVGIIDQDYYYSDNEGHIFIKMTNESTYTAVDPTIHPDKIISLKSGEAFAQGIFVEYGITEDDNVEDTRNGGMGSTDK